MCDVIGCDQSPEFFDEMDNKLCQDCVDREIQEEGHSPEEYEGIVYVENA